MEFSNFDINIELTCIYYPACFLDYQLCCFIIKLYMGICIFRSVWIKMWKLCIGLIIILTLGIQHVHYCHLKKHCIFLKSVLKFMQNYCFQLCLYCLLLKWLSAALDMAVCGCNLFSCLQFRAGVFVMGFHCAGQLSHQAVIGGVADGMSLTNLRYLCTHLGTSHGNLRYLCTIILNFSSCFSHTSYNVKVTMKNKSPKNYLGNINNLANVKIYLTNLQIYLTNLKIYLTKTFSRKFNDMIRYYLSKTNFGINTNKIHFTTYKYVYKIYNVSYILYRIILSDYSLLYKAQLCLAIYIKCTTTIMIYKFQNYFETTTTVHRLKVYPCNLKNDLAYNTNMPYLYTNGLCAISHSKSFLPNVNSIQMSLETATKTLKLFVHTLEICLSNLKIHPVNLKIIVINLAKVYQNIFVLGFEYRMILDIIRCILAKIYFVFGILISIIEICVTTSKCFCKFSSFVFHMAQNNWTINISWVMTLNYYCKSLLSNFIWHKFTQLVCLFLNVSNSLLKYFISIYILCICMYMCVYLYDYVCVCMCIISICICIHMTHFCSIFGV